MTKTIARAGVMVVLALVVGHANLVAGAQAESEVRASPTGEGRDRYCLTSYSVEESASSPCRMAGRADMAISAISPFGELPVAYCELSYTLHFESDGGVVLDRLLVGGSAPCGDVRPCSALMAEGEAQPWPGEVKAGKDGRFVLDLDACFDTCIGWFDGRLKLDLDRVANRWRLRADRSPVGDSGLELRGDWWLEGRDVALERK